MKKALLFIFLIPLSIALYSQGVQETNVNYEKVNFGIKTGFTSTIFLTSSFQVGDYNIKQIQNNYKVGYAGSLFMRYNMNAHYIQPELVYSLNRGEVTFEKHGKEKTLNPEFASVDSKLHCIELPILYGYNFIKKDIYGMSFFIGPKLRYLWESKNDIIYTNFDQTDIKEDFRPINFGFTGGVAVYISKIFFDFRYEQIVHNISKRVSYVPDDATQPQGQMKLHRRDNTLSFSLGVMF